MTETPLSSAPDAVRSARRPGPSLELILAWKDWRAVVEAFAGGGPECLAGPTGIRETTESVSVLCRRLDTARADRLAPLLARWGDLLCVLPVQRSPFPSLASQLADTGLAGARRATLLLVGRGEAAGLAAGATAIARRLRPLDRIVVVGPACPSWELARGGEHPPAVPLPERWSRTAGALTPEVWRRLRESRVAIAGCGRNGSAAAVLLARQGAGTLLLLDPDRIEEGNLDATLCARPQDVGEPKARVLARRLAESGAKSELVAVEDAAESAAGLRWLRRADLVVTAVDRDAPRLAVAHLASAYLKPHLDVGTGIFYRDGGRERVMGADIRFLLPGEGCVLCAGGLRDEEAAREALFEPPPRTRAAGASERRVWSEERAGSLLSLNLAAVARGIQVWLDFLAGRVRSSRWIRFRWDAQAHHREDDLQAQAAPDCSVCASSGLGDYRFGPG